MYTYILCIYLYIFNVQNTFYKSHDLCTALLSYAIKKHNFIHQFIFLLFYNLCKTYIPTVNYVFGIYYIIILQRSLLKSVYIPTSVHRCRVSGIRKKYSTYYSRSCSVNSKCTYNHCNIIIIILYLFLWYSRESLSEKYYSLGQ